MIPALTPHSRTINTHGSRKANSLADAWIPIFQGSTKSQNVVPVIDWMRPGSTHDVSFFRWSYLITEARVAAAMKDCKLRKACGPDELGNDWYRQYTEVLVPLLTQLYKMWYTDQVYPAFFSRPDIFCLKKQGDGSNPLNYCPLALLNTDYKILMRLIATQVRSSTYANQCTPTWICTGQEYLHCD